MRLLCRYAGGLACLVTALALVACGGGPGSQPEPKQIEDIAFQLGEKVRTIPLSDKFSGSDLTYSATTSNSSVATVTVDNDAGTLTVTVVGAGTATITVTAKNSQGEAKQTFAVTVPKPPAPDPVEIQDIPSLEEDATRTIPLGDKFSGENLTYGASSSNVRVATVTVDDTSDTLTVTAVGAGTATITVTATATAQGSTPQTQTFTVTVPQPAADEVAPTARTATSSVSVAQGGTQPVTLSTVFTGENLAFTVRSSAPAIATASESGGTLTISGVSIGSATITVVATNDAGNAEHEITVTVTAPATTPPTTPTPTPTNNPSSCASPLEINRLHNAKCTLPDDHSLIYELAAAAVSVNGPGTGATENVWTITAKKKGRHVLYISDDDTGNTVGEILVVVPNSPPVLVQTEVVAAADLFADTSGEVGGIDPTTSTLTLGAYFDDVDEEDNAEGASDADPTSNGFGDFKYKISYKPEGVVFDIDKGFLAFTRTSTAGSEIGGTLEAVVLKKPEGDTFTVQIYAYDKDNAPSDNPVTLTFSSVDPVKQESDTSTAANAKYIVGQDATTGDFTIPGDARSLKVGNRLDVDHKIEFTGVTGVTGFRFADLAVREIAKRGLLPSTTTGASGSECEGNKQPTTVATGTTLDGSGGCYTYSASSRVKITDIDAAGAAGAAPEVTFQLPSNANMFSGASVTVTFRYYVVTAKAKPRDEDDPADGVDDELGALAAAQMKWTLAGSEPLTLNVHKCTTTTDCP